MENHQLIVDYLRRLDRAAAALPAQRRNELLAEIRTHIDDALSDAGRVDDVTILNILERLGPPDDIVAATFEGETPAPSSTAALHRGYAKVALIVLALGFIAPFIGWVIGAILVAVSGGWSVREKVVGLALGILALFVLAPILALAIGPGSSIGTVELIVLSWGIAGLVSALYLGLRLHQSYAPAL